MFKNYFKTAWRNMRRTPGIALINIIGLGLGMAVAVVITVWLKAELSYNRSIPGYKNISQVMVTGTFSGEVSTDPTCSVPMAAALRTKYGSDFKRVVLTTQSESHILAYNDKKMIASGSFAENGYADLFSLQAIRGSLQSLNDPSSVFISESLARSLLGSIDVIGRSVKIDNRDYLKIAAVYKDVPANFSYAKDLDYIAPWNYYASLNPGVEERWNECRFLIFVQLPQQADNDKLSGKISGLLKPHLTDIDPVVLLHPMSKWHLYETFKNGKNTGGRIQYVWMFALIGFFVLLLACINFMNLSTARSERRAKEIGVLKVIGSGKADLVARFLTESVLTALMAFLLALLLVVISLPLFSRLTGSSLLLPYKNVLFWLICLLFLLLTGFCAGIYPSFYLSSFKPASVLKGNFKVGKGSGILRKILVVTQFSASIFLIIATLIVLQQLNHTRNRPLGYSGEKLINIPADHFDAERRYNALKAELLQSGAVTTVALSSSPVNKLSMSNGGYMWEGIPSREGAIFGSVAVNEDFAPTVQWKFKEGRNFSKELLTDSSGLIINEMAARYMGMPDAVGKIITFRNRKYQIIGVIEDAVMGSPFASSVPTAFFLGNWFPMNCITVRLSAGLPVTAALGRIKKVMEKFDKEVPFEYSFVDERYDRYFRSVETIGIIAGIFTALAIVISCLGLYALAAFVAEQRTKEVGIRKVLGASVIGLWRMLSFEFIVLTAIAFLIAVPVVYWSMDQWLENYAYRIAISWKVFAAAGGLIVVVTLLTVSYQAIKAAVTDPVKSLRSE
ncbi:MAG TPA: ABC transporter permease [Niabella sp.]